MMITEFSDELQKNAHSLFQNWRLNNPTGFFLTPKTKGSYLLHHVGCSHIGDPFWRKEDTIPSRGSPHSLTANPKICSLDIAELLHWIKRGGFVNGICRHCIDNKDPSLVKPSSSARLSAEGWALEPNQPLQKDLAAVMQMHKEPQYWVIKGNPHQNDWHEMLVPGNKSTWHTGRPPRNWSKGDRLFCWESTPSLCMVGFAQIIDINKGQDEDGDLLFEVEYLTTPLDYRPTLSELRSIEELKDCSFLKRGPATTVFPLTQDQAAVIYQLIFLKSQVKQNVWPDLLEESLPDFPDVDDLVMGQEGQKRLVQHFRRERNRAIIKKKKEQTLKACGKIACEICGFDFGKVYGDLGANFCEVHHLIPLSESNETRETSLSDLITICSNCHRMIHRLPSKDSMETLKACIEGNKGDAGQKPKG